MWHHHPRFPGLPDGMVTAIDQVCTVVSDFDGTVASLHKLGIGPFKCWDVQPPALFNTTFGGEAAPWSMRLGVALVGRMQWEVIQPISGPSVYTEHLERSGNGLHHILLETRGTRHGTSVERLEAQGYEHRQTGMLNLPLLMAGLTIPAAPALLAAPLSTHFGYMDTHEDLKTTLELARFPPGVSRPLGIRIGKPDFWAPADASNVESSLPGSVIDEIVMLGFVVRDLDATVRAWADKAKVGPWHIVDLAPESFSGLQLTSASGAPRARVAWTLVGDTLLEIVQPLEGTFPHQAVLESRGEGMHYVGVRSQVVPTDDSVAHLEAQGAQVLMKGILHGGFQFTLLDTYELAKTWLQFVELGAADLFAHLCQLQPSVRYPAQ